MIYRAEKALPYQRSEIIFFCRIWGDLLSLYSCLLSPDIGSCTCFLFLVSISKSDIQKHRRCKGDGLCMDVYRTGVEGWYTDEVVIFDVLPVQDVKY